MAVCIGVSGCGVRHMGMSVYHIKYTREKGGGLENEDDVRKLSGYNFTLGVDMFATIWTGPARV